MSLRLAHSLRARLFWYLLAAVILAALVQGLIAYRTALAAADEIFDYHMQQMALSLRPGLPLGLLADAGQPDHSEENYDLIVQVWSLDGSRVFLSAPGAALPRQAAPGFSNVRAHGTIYRMYSVRSDTQIIEVAQDMSARREMAGTLALRTVGPIALMVPLLMLVVWWVVSRSLAPVSRVRRQVAERRADDLSPVSEAGLPDEIQPLVHELNLLFHRVAQAFEAQQHFVGDAAHELRSPLAALKLQAQALQRAVGDEARGVAIARLLSGIDRATHLIEQLLVLARQEASAAAGAKPKRLSLADAARAAVADAVSSAQARRVDVGLSHAEEGCVLGHPAALAILLRNLLDNAIKYAPAAGRVDVEVSASDGQVILTVEDTGPGIAPEDRERVLDRFYRVSGAQASGSGLGLAIVNSIAGLHAAAVTLDVSPRLGGLRVAVRFPAAA